MHMNILNKMIRLRWTTNHPIRDEISRNRLNQMRQGGLLTDMVLTSGLQVYHCHRIVVSAASPFIREIIETSAALSKTDAVVVSINEDHLPQIDHLMQFMYLGVLIIEPLLLPELCKLANKLLIKFLVDGVAEPLSLPMGHALPAKVKAIDPPLLVQKGNKRRPPAPIKPKNKRPQETGDAKEKKCLEKNSSQKNIREKPESSCPIPGKTQQRQGKQKVIKNDLNKLAPSKKNVTRPRPSIGRQGHQQPGPSTFSNKNWITPKTSSSNDGSLSGAAKRLKKKALNFLASARNPNSSMKRIPRRKQRIIRDHKTGNQNTNEIGLEKKKVSPVLGAQSGQGIVRDAEQSVNILARIENDPGRLRRRAYLKAGINVKMYISRMNKR